MGMTKKKRTEMSDRQRLGIVNQRGPLVPRTGHVIQNEKHPVGKRARRQNNAPVESYLKGYGE